MLYWIKTITLPLAKRGDSYICQQLLQQMPAIDANFFSFGSSYFHRQLCALQYPHSAGRHERCNDDGVGISRALEMKMDCILIFLHSLVCKCLREQKYLKLGCSQSNCNVFPKLFTLYPWIRKWLLILFGLKMVTNCECQKKNTHRSPIRRKFSIENST